MRTLLVFLLVTIASATALGQEQAKPAAVPEVPDVRPVRQVAIHYPEGWRIGNVNWGGIIVSTYDKSWGDPDLPPAPHPWFMVMAVPPDMCVLDRGIGEYEASKDGKPFKESYGCKFGYLVVAGYWDDDKEQNSHAVVMAEMYDKLKLAK